jgi:hypothetical protein
MSFIKTADSELLEIIKTTEGKDKKIEKCPKCGQWHDLSEPCPEVKDERTGKDK